MEYLSNIAVVAHVRQDGAIGEFYPRTFDLMLDQRQPQDKQLREAIRILRQLGYETRGVYFATNPGTDMDRITDKDLQALAARLNAITCSPATPYSMGPDGVHHANVGNFHISHAYGGVCLHRMSNTGGGVHTVLSHGHVSKRELYNQMRAYIAGMEQAPAAQEQRA